MDIYSKEQKDVRMNDQQSDSTCEFSGSAAWRGKFNITGHNININIAAHVSNKACLDVASIMPNFLFLEIIPRIDVWPESFKSSPPDEHSVSLFFFPEERDGEVFHSLVRYAIFGDFSLKASIGESELLIFTSFQLPRKIHRFQGKLYLWGVFKGLVADTNQSEHHLHIQTPTVKLSLSANSCGQKSFDDERSYDGKEIIISNSSEHGPLTITSKAKGRGRRLDDAWQYAKPVDVLRQKAECYYCGFISMYGGISRLKAHLGGGHPKTCLPGCKKVLPDVKKSMADWFNEWAKKSKAIWMKEVRAEIAALDVAVWEGQKMDSKSSNFDFSRGKISHHNVLGERGSNSHAVAWPKESPEMKRVENSFEMEVAVSEQEKSLTASWVNDSQVPNLFRLCSSKS